MSSYHCFLAQWHDLSVKKQVSKDKLYVVHISMEFVFHHSISRHVHSKLLIEVLKANKHWPALKLKKDVTEFWQYYRENNWWNWSVNTDLPIQIDTLVFNWDQVWRLYGLSPQMSTSFLPSKDEPSGLC